MSHYQTTTVKRPCNHPLHLILTFITFGMWAPVWIVCAMTGRTETQRVHAPWAPQQLPPVVQGGPGYTQSTGYVSPERGHGVRAYQWNPYKGEWQ